MSAADSPNSADDESRRAGNDNGFSLASATRQYAHYATVGIMFPVAVALGFFLGYLLDRQLGTIPLFAIVGLALGVAAAVRNLLRTIASDVDD